MQPKKKGGGVGEGKKVTWEWLVAFATYHIKIRELTSHVSKKKKKLKQKPINPTLQKKWSNLPTI